MRKEEYMNILTVRHTHEAPAKCVGVGIDSLRYTDKELHRTAERSRCRLGGRTGPLRGLALRSCLQFVSHIGQCVR